MKNVFIDDLRHGIFLFIQVVIYVRKAPQNGFKMALVGMTLALW